MFVGRFTDIKNPLYAIDVIKECHRLDDRFEGLICGDGRIADRVQSKIQSEGLGDCVHLLGNREDVNELYMADDYLIMPSLFEGFPFVLVEAQANGLPCVASADVIPQEADVGIGLVTHVNLEERAEVWAQKCLARKREEKIDKQKAQNAVKMAGYDMEDTAKWLADFYTEKWV